MTFRNEQSRRGFLASVAGALSVSFVGPALGQEATRQFEGRFTTTRGSRLGVHTYTSPDKGWQATSHIVELSDQLIVVDGQYMLPYAREVVAFSKQLRKPISRLYISHFHPDHHLGAEAFDAPTYALADVKTKIAAIGDRLASEERAKFPDEPGIIPEHAIKPGLVVEPGTEKIGGETFEFRVVRHAEADPSLIIGLPDDKILIAQDLIYNRVHLFLGEKNFDGWIAALNEYRALPYVRILPGHGVPGGPELYGQMIDYLTFAQNALAHAPDAEAFTQALLKQYPGFGGTALLEHQQRFLFKKT